MTSPKTIIADMQAENDNLRHQLAEALSIRENCTLVPTHELKKLHEQLADSEAERLEQARLLGMSGEREAGMLADIERLKGECLSLAIESTPGIQLAASQAREQRLRKHIALALEFCDIPAFSVAENLANALAIPQDTSAIEAMIANAGEVMREKVIKQCVAMGIMLRDGAFVEEIRDLPCVKLSEIK